MLQTAFHLNKAKNYKENTYIILTDAQKACRYSLDCKQNKTYWFQIVNLSFSGRNSATFNAKVAEFFT